MKQRVIQRLQQAITTAATESGWEGLNDFIPEIDRPRQPEHGDFATNAALVLAPRLKLKPRDIAVKIQQAIDDSSQLFEKIDIAGPGFINLRLTAHAWQQSLGDIVWPDFAQPNIGQGEKVLIEYVSANPTGPLHVGNARGGPLGDSLARLLAQAGYAVTTEFYVNDVGGQVVRLGQSLLHWLKATQGIESEMPEGGYFGEYIKEMAADLAQNKEHDYLAMNEESAVHELATWGVRYLLEEIGADCEAMGAHFDRWVHEAELRSEVEDLLKKLTSAGATVEKEGALWFIPPERDESSKTTERDSIEDRESVLRKSDGEATYFTDDIICHDRRFRDGFERIIDVWGANHHGHVPRIQSALKVLGHDPEKFEVVLYQYVRVCRGKETVKMSKRAGDYVLARDVLDEVGRDAMRFFLLQRAPSAHLDFDLELATKESPENPIYYIQYAHARICSIQRKAEQNGYSLPDRFQNIDATQIDLPEELRLLQKIWEYPEEITQAAQQRAPHRIAFYLLELARFFHNYYTQAKGDSRYHVVSEDIDRSQAKLYFVATVKAVLANGLRLLNLSTPEAMSTS